MVPQCDSEVVIVDRRFENDICVEAAGPILRFADESRRCKMNDRQLKSIAPGPTPEASEDASSISVDTFVNFGPVGALLSLGIRILGLRVKRRLKPVVPVSPQCFPDLRGRFGGFVDWQARCGLVMTSVISSKSPYEARNTIVCTPRAIWVPMTPPSSIESSVILTSSKNRERSLGSSI